MQKETTGATISRLGVLTVLANNLLATNDSGELTPEGSAKLRADIVQIAEGKAGVPAAKVAQRSKERCILGGAAISFGPVTWGWN